jgi:hypothetical protein
MSIGSEQRGVVIAEADVNDCVAGLKGGSRTSNASENTTCAIVMAFVIVCVPVVVQTPNEWQRCIETVIFEFSSMRVHKSTAVST